MFTPTTGRRRRIEPSRNLYVAVQGGCGSLRFTSKVVLGSAKRTCNIELFVKESIVDTTESK